MKISSLWYSPITTAGVGLFSSWSCATFCDVIYQILGSIRSRFTLSTSRIFWRYFFCCKEPLSEDSTELRFEILSRKFSTSINSGTLKHVNSELLFSAQCNFSRILCEEYLSPLKFKPLLLLTKCSTEHFNVWITSIRWNLIRWRTSNVAVNMWTEITE